MNTMKIIMIGIIFNLLLATAFNGMNTAWNTQTVIGDIENSLAPYIGNDEGSTTDRINEFKPQAKGTVQGEEDWLSTNIMNPVTNAISGIANTFEGMFKVGLMVTLTIVFYLSSIVLNPFNMFVLMGNTVNPVIRIIYLVFALIVTVMNIVTISAFYDAFINKKGMNQ